MSPAAPYGAKVHALTGVGLGACDRDEWFRWMGRGSIPWVHDRHGREVKVNGAPDVDPLHPDPVIEGHQLWALWMAPRSWVLVQDHRGRCRVTREALMVEGESVVLTQFQGEILYRLTEGLWTEAANRLSSELLNGSETKA